MYARDTHRLYAKVVKQKGHSHVLRLHEETCSLGGTRGGGILSLRMR